MQDRFKFRFFDKKKQKMMYENSNFSDYCKDEWWGYEEQMALEALDVFDNPEHYILMQCTGLKDKNGKLIYEWDICRNSKSGEVFNVVWHNPLASFCWQKHEHSHIYSYGELFRAFDYYEVIGNIYENPELLEVSNDY